MFKESIQFISGLIFLAILTAVLFVTFTAMLGVLKEVDPHLNCTLEGSVGMIPAPYDGKKDIKGKLICLQQEFYLFEEVKK